MKTRGGLADYRSLLLPMPPPAENNKPLESVTSPRRDAHVLLILERGGISCFYSILLESKHNVQINLRLGRTDYDVLEERYCETAGVHASHANSNKQCINNAHFSGITSTRLCKTKVRSGFGTRLTKHSFHKREEERQHKKGAMNVLQSSRCLLLLSILLSTDLSAFAGKVLVFPVEGSHWVNMNLLIEDLHSSGHEVTVVRTTSSC
ncbi:hypothetical protein Q8A67_024761 [Cirrhinus molitorella]|uniref:Uncharacterized protein n=1 Tax=Cirrhinus molitorella TaxID=172907 RepID=A0AA88P569_9TELE|nr:hypothetical protein Q8A67_024761 [Cirrhinus molitorella]